MLRGAHPEGVVARRFPLLGIAVSVVAAQALALAGLGSWLALESARSRPSNADVAQGSAVYFLVLAVLVGLVAESLRRRQGWSAGPAVLVQLLALPMAWYMARAGLLLGALPLGTAAVLGLGCLVAPSTQQALGR